MGCGEFVGDFIASRAGLSPKTVKTYREMLAYLQKFDGKAGDFVAWLNGLGLAQASIASICRHTRVYFGWCGQMGYEIGVWAAWKPIIKVPRKIPKAITPFDFEAMLACASFPRDRALLLMLRDSGARAGSLAGLTWADINEKQKTAFIQTKGGQLQCLFLSSRVMDALAAWKPESKTASVFGLKYGGMKQALKRLKMQAGVTGRANAHSFRHAFARDTLAKGADLTTVSKLLGHSDISVTAQNYAIWSHTELQSAYAKFWG